MIWRNLIFTFIANQHIQIDISQKTFNKSGQKAIVPIYSATKAALHSFSISLRKQLADTSVKVFELLPPIVDTNLNRCARDKRGRTDKGISAEKVAIETLKAIENNQFEIPIGIVKVLKIGVRVNPKLFLKIVNKKSPIQKM